MTQEVLKLALEALEEAWYHVGTFQPTEKAIDLYDEARTAIKEALRENAMREVQRLGQEIEQEPVVWMYQDKSTHEVKFQKHMRGFVDHGATYETPLYTTPPQRKPEQEPVELETVYETIIQWDEGGGKRSRRELARRIVSLYTTPQQRKPLTPDQVFAIADQHPVEGFDPEIMAFARAIEAAHGIKGEA